MPAVTGWSDHESPLPTLDGMVVGIIDIQRHEAGQKVVTVQCSTCYRTYTNIMIIALRTISFAADSEFSGAEPFRRCSECRKAGRVPDDAEELRHYQKFRLNARGALMLSDKWRETQDASLRARGARRAELEDLLKDMLMRCDEESRIRAERAWQGG